MTDTQLMATVIAAVAGPQGALLLAGHVANHPENVARSWADGCEWARARAADARTARDTVRRYLTVAVRSTGRAALAGVLAVLCAVLRAHGRHRSAPSSALPAAFAAPQTIRFTQTGGPR